MKSNKNFVWEIPEDQIIWYVSLFDRFNPEIMKRYFANVKKTKIN